MTDNLKYKYKSVINTIGEEKVNELYNLLGSEKISMATLHRFITREKIIISLSEKKSVSRLAMDNGVSKMTIYRQLKRK